MSSSRKSSRREQTQFFPEDPSTGVVFKPQASDVARLKKDFLSTALLEYIIHLTMLVTDSSSCTEPGVQTIAG